MNDRFKFRVWCKNKKEWEKDCIFGVNGNLSSVVFLRQDSINSLNLRATILNSENHTIEQCTGLKDNNDKLIYEGDIIKDAADIWVVIFDRYTATYQAIYQKCTAIWATIDSFRYLEIIGNIHENSDLLDI